MEKKLQVECEVVLASFESNTALRNNDVSGDFCGKFWHLLCLIELEVTGIGHLEKWGSSYTSCLWRNLCKIYFLQETHLNGELESQWKNEWGTEVIFSHESLSAHGFAKVFIMPSLKLC